MLQLVDRDSPGGLRALLQADSGNINPGFSERRSFDFYCPAAGAFELFVDDEPLPKRRVRGREYWSWTPGFYAGTVRAELQASGEVSARTYLLDVTPDPKKLGQDAFLTLIHDILAADPSLLLGDEPGTHAAGGTEPHDTIHLRYAILFQYGPRLLGALRAIQDRPRRSLVSKRVVVPLSRVRRADAHTALIMARNGSLSSLIAAVRGATRATERHDWRFNIPLSTESLDCAATRCITALTESVLKRARQIYSALEQIPTDEGSSKFHTALSARLPRRLSFLSSLADSLEGLLAQDPFASTTRTGLSTSGLTAVAADPRYARAQRLTWEILRPRAASFASEAWSWMSPTWDLYERWCFVRLSQLLQESLPHLTWSRPNVAADDADRCLEGVAANERVRLLWQPNFSRTGNQGPLTSISNTLRPDFSLTVDRDGSHRWFVFDAKYSQSKYSVMIAMRSAHIYHDALRYFQSPPDYSLLLLPSAGSDIGWLHDPAFKADHGVGVVICSPDDADRDTLATEMGRMMGTSS